MPTELSTTKATSASTASGLGTPSPHFGAGLH